MRPVNVRDYESLAREKLEPQLYDFMAGGAEDEISLADNTGAWSRIRLLPRVLVDVQDIDTSTRVLGEPLSLPLLLAPVPYHRLADPDGERATARAAAEAGILMVLSAMSTVAIEAVAEAAAGPRWFQMYIYPQRDFTQRLVKRAETAGFTAICLTVDTPYLGRRERDIQNLLQFPPTIFPVNFLDAVAVRESTPGESAVAAQEASALSPSVTWEDVAWLRSITSLPVVLKGILAAEDAKIAAEHGVAGIIVSNHGGRQLDGVPAPIDLLPEIVEAVAGRVPVLVDGGVRRGTDVLKALALGAEAVLIGRPYIWGLAVEGESGVGKVVRMIQDEFRLAMALCGCRSVRDISPALVRV